MDVPTVQEVFYEHNEPTYLLPTDPFMEARRNPYTDLDVSRRTYPLVARDLTPPRFRTRALVAPQSNAVTTIHHPPGLVMRVPMCCEKCIAKVREVLLDLKGVRDVICDQYEQKVIISGNVDPEQALRRLRRVKKKSSFWREATQPLLYSASKSPGLLQSNKALDTYSAPTYTSSAYRAPVYTSSLNRAPLYTPPLIRQPSASYARYISPPRRYTSSYSRAYSSPYIDSAYRSGYGETRYNHYNSAFDRYSYNSNFHVDPSKGTPYLQMHDDY